MRQGRFVSALVALVAVVGLLFSPAVEAKKKDKKGGKVNPYKLMLKDKLPEVSEADLALDAVPFAPGAPAVMLLDAEQQEFYNRVTEVFETRSLRLRRVKILDASAVDTWGQFSRRLPSDTKIEKVEARTTLADGTEIPAGEDNVQIDETPSGGKLVTVSFPRVEPGAILDVLLITNVEAILTTEWQLQHSIPVLDSRFVYSPPSNLQFTMGAMNLSDGSKMEPLEARSAKGRSLVWHFTDLPPIPEEPNQPPILDVAEVMFILPTALSGPGYHLEFATDWPTWNKRNHESWNLWIQGGKRSAKALAEEVVAGAADARAKADAVRRAVLERVRIEFISDWPVHNGPDAVLNAGAGSSADVAALNVAMLRAVGVDAHLVVYRMRHNGSMPPGFPITVMFDDLLVRIDGGMVYCPTAMMPVGLLPYRAAGVVAMPIDGTSTSPLRLAEPTASAHGISRMANLELGLDGSLSGTTVQAYRGVAAESWRSRLRYASDDERREEVRESLARYLPGVVVESLEIDHLEDDGTTLTLRTELRVDGYAVAAGDRMLVNPVLFSRVDPEDWSAQGRSTMIDLGGPLNVTDTVNIKLPEGVADVETPDGAKLNAGQIGSYDLTHSANATYLTSKRKRTLNVYRFPPEAWTDLRDMFSEMAKADDTPVIVSMPGS